jgi:hypothetical protein
MKNLGLGEGDRDGGKKVIEKERNNRSKFGIVSRR